ncbi:MAG TPA: helix-turn-helix domain-containing protein [Microthrixaceae bacterium]|nr:helix-turn-helix domain-containing protein [Microthrixaceae bacterium]
MLDEQATSEALRRLRELSGMSQRVAARQIGVDKRTLRDWESRRSAPDESQVARATAIYGRGLGSLLTERQSIVDPLTPGIISVGSEEVDISQIRRDNPGIHNANRATLVAYLDAVRRSRGIPVEGIVELRSVDIQALARELDISDEALGELLSEIFHLTPAGTQAATRAILIGSLMALTAVGVITGPWFAPAASAAPAAQTPATQQSTQQSEARPVEQSAVAPTTSKSVTDLFSTSPFGATGPSAQTDSSLNPAGPTGDGSAVFSVSPREPSQADDSLPDATGPLPGQGLQALPAGSPELPDT